MPKGEIVEALTEEPGENGLIFYWLGDTPETAPDGDQTLILLIADPETDEVDAFRTSVNMLASEEPLADVSLYIYRDDQADRLEEEKYNVFFFDTPEGEMSLVKVVTNTMNGREMEMPMSLHLVLRAFPMTGAAVPAYCKADQVLILCDTENGKVNALNGAYSAVMNENVFESEYVQIEGLTDGNLTVTVKRDQPIWPEWTGPDTAETIDGRHFTLTDGRWYQEEPDAKYKAGNIK